MDKKLQEILTSFKEKEGNLIVLTVAGISSESGIPTFRGKDGFLVSWYKQRISLKNSKFFMCLTPRSDNE